MKRQLQKIILLLAVILGGLNVRGAETAPKYIFYFIGDGMGMGPVMAAQTYLRTVKQPSASLNMTSMPVWSFIQTYSANTPVTDSAAAGTALSTGSKTKNSMLGMNADTVAVTSVAKVLRDMGYGIGIVTSVAPDDATPGAFYAHVPARSMYYEIGMQAATCGYEFLAGAGLRGIRNKQGEDTGLLKAFEENDVQMIYGPDEIEKINTRKVFLLNPKDTPAGNLGYTIDSIKGVLDLPLITGTCLAHLEKYTPDRFFMMVEGGNIDHALHANDAGAAIKEVVNFDSAIGIALDFYRQHPDETLIVVTADHDTGGLALGNPYVKYNAVLKYIDSQKISKEMFSQYCRDILDSRRTFTWDDMKAELEAKLGLFSVVPVSEKDGEKLRELFDETFEKRNEGGDQKTLYASFNRFAVEVFKVIDKATGLAFTTTSHTGNPVPLFAIGVGAEKFSGLGNNHLIAPEIITLVKENGK